MTTTAEFVHLHAGEVHYCLSLGKAFGMIEDGCGMA